MSASPLLMGKVAPRYPASYRWLICRVAATCALPGDLASGDQGSEGAPLHGNRSDAWRSGAPLRPFGSLPPAPGWRRLAQRARPSAGAMPLSGFNTPTCMSHCLCLALRCHLRDACARRGGRARCTPAPHS